MQMHSPEPDKQNEGDAHAEHDPVVMNPIDDCESNDEDRPERFGGPVGLAPLLLRRRIVLSELIPSVHHGFTL